MDITVNMTMAVLMGGIKWRANKVLIQAESDRV